MPRHVSKEFALSNPLRTQLLDVVQQEPGINMSNLSERLACRPSTVIWHTTKLERAGLLRSERVGNLRVYYVASGGVPLRKQTIATALLQHDTARRIHDVVQREPGITLARLTTQLVENASVLRWHVRRLVAGGVLCLDNGKGRAFEYYPSAHAGAPCQHTA